MRLCEKNSKPLGSRTIRMQRNNDVEEPRRVLTHRFLLQVLSRSGPEEPFRLSRSRGTLPHAFQGPGSAARPQRPWGRLQSGVRASSAGEARVSRVALGF